MYSEEAALKIYPADEQRPSLKILKLGLVRYSEAWRLQRELQQRLIQSGKSGFDSEDTLIICQHYPVITVGRAAKEDGLKVPLEVLNRRGIEILHVERGGDITYHDPGQLVVYPILDLRRHRQDVDWYMRALEEVIINSLKTFKVDSFRVKGRTGVWTLSNCNNYNLPGRTTSANPVKIAAIGVRISRWCTLHGVSINVANCQQGFSLINPCGMSDVEVTSLEELAVISDLEGVAQSFVASFRQIFSYC